MAKKIVLDTDLLLAEKLKDLSPEDAYSYLILKLNPWVNKSGICRYPGDNLIKFLGYKKFLTAAQIKNIDELAENDLGDPISEQDKEDKKVSLANLVLKKKIMSYAELELLMYDIKGHIIFFPDYNEYVPISGRPLIVAKEFLNSIENLKNHQFWHDYWQKNRIELEAFFEKGLIKKNTKDYEELLKCYTKLKKIFMKN